jgi:hypothetical protein
MSAESAGFDPLGFAGLIRIGIDAGVRLRPFWRLGRLPMRSGALLRRLTTGPAGLWSAEEHAVRHPLLEAGIGKSLVRAMADYLGVPSTRFPAQGSRHKVFQGQFVPRSVRSKLRGFKLRVLRADG